MTPDRIKLPAAFWLGMDRLMIRRSELLRAAGLPVAAGRDNARLTTGQFFALWRGLEVLRGPDVGLALLQILDGSLMPPSFLVGYHARTLGDALHRVARFKALCAPEELRMTMDGDFCMLSMFWPHRGTDAVPHALTDATLAALLEMARIGTGTDIRPQRVDLQRAPSPAVADYLKCKVRWSAASDQMILHKADLALPFLKYNQDLLDLLDAALESQLADVKSNATLADQVRWLLRRSLTAGHPDLRSIARDLATSERSLQRRLNAEGQRFQDILSEVRHTLACDYLAQPSFDIAEIAYLLGYEHQGSFYRAFQKWEGTSPAGWRDGRNSGGVLPALPA